MGADFLFCEIPYAKINKERRKLLLDVAKKVTLENFRDPPWNNNLEARATMRRCVEWYTNNPLGRRDVITIRQEGAIYESLITGGMSWGDGPTDAYDVMSNIDGCEPIFMMIRKWAIADTERKDRKARGSS